MVSGNSPEFKSPSKGQGGGEIPVVSTVTNIDPAVIRKCTSEDQLGHVGSVTRGGSVRRLNNKDAGIIRPSRRKRSRKRHSKQLPTRPLLESRLWANHAPLVDP